MGDDSGWDNDDLDLDLGDTGDDVVDKNEKSNPLDRLAAAAPSQGVDVSKLAERADAVVTAGATAVFRGFGGLLKSLTELPPELEGGEGGEDDSQSSSRSSRRRRA